jgi:hypothetical protein
VESNSKPTRSKLCFGECFGKLVIPKLFILDTTLPLVTVPVVKVSTLIVNLAFLELREIAFNELLVYLSMALGKF